jgi:processive 1,2-diacylglycerol beta-glucosyltransferase
MTVRRFGLKVPRIGRLEIPARLRGRLAIPAGLRQRWRARLRAQRRWWRERRRGREDAELLFPAAGKGMVAVQTLSEAPPSGPVPGPGPRIAILHASAGTGHQAAARALAAAIAERAPAAIVREVDTLVFASRLYRDTYAASYNTMAARAPALWGVLYHSWARARVNRGTAPVRLAMDRLNLRRLVRVVDEEAADAVVCTHFLPVEALSPARARGRLNAALYCVITDFTAHPFWAFQHVDRYFVASDQVAAELAGHGVPRDRIQVTGIPVHPRFARRIGRAEARARLGVEGEGPLVLVMGGGHGVGPLSELAERLAGLPQAPQVVVVCGTNARLRSRVSALPSAQRGRVRAIGFTTDVDAWFEACDVVVSKAGGLTCSEALVKGTPMVVFRPTPGQEVKNAEFLERAGTARHAESVDEVAATVKRWLADPDLRRRVRQAAARAAAPHAAETIAERVLQGLRLPDRRRA